MTGKGTAQRGAGGAGRRAKQRQGAARVCSGIGAVRQRGDERWHSAARYGAGEAAREMRGQSPAARGSGNVRSGPAEAKCHSAMLRQGNGKPGQGTVRRDEARGDAAHGVGLRRPSHGAHRLGQVTGRSGNA